MSTNIDKIFYLKMLWKGVGLGGANFSIHSSNADNKILAAMLRILANEICSEDDEYSKRKAEKFISYIKEDIRTRIPL